MSSPPEVESLRGEWGPPIQFSEFDLAIVLEACGISADVTPHPRSAGRALFSFPRSSRLVDIICRWADGSLVVAEADLAAARRRLRARAVLVREQDGGAR